MAEEDPRLPAGAEALLQGLPLPEPDFEALATRIDARVATTVPGSTDDALLAAPFPDEAGEELPAPAQPAAPRLSDLARAVAQKRTDAADTELAREALSAASKLRSQTDVLVERMRAAPKAAEPPLRPAAAEAVPARPLPPPPVPRAEAYAASAPPPARTEKEKKSSLTAFWGGAGLVLAAAAAWVVLVGSPKKPEASRADTAVAAAPAASAVAQVEVPKEVEHPLPPVAAAETTPAPAAEPAAAEQVAIAKGGASRGADSEGSSAASAPVAARAKKSSARPEKVELDAAPAKPAAQAPAGPSNQDAQLKPAAGEPAEDLMPDKPSTGAVQAAIASVMGSARSCVAGADGPTPATVIFGSNGSVKSVVVGGAVEGTPAGKCISAALSRAKVAPFAQSSFSVGVSVRP
jgi:hypothetical protein